MAFGFLVEKFDLFLEVTARTLGGRAPTASNELVGDVSSLLLIFLGGTMMVVATIRYRQVGRDVDAADPGGIRGTRMDIALVTRLLGLGGTLFAYLGYTVLRHLS